MRTSISKPLTFVVISVLVVALVYVSISALNVFAAPNKAPPNADCVLEDVPGVTDKVQTCCWTEMTYGSSFAVKFCQHCNSDGTGCGLKTQIGLTSPPSGPVAPLQGGVLEQPPTPPPTGPAAPLQGGVLERQQLQPPAEQGVAELPPPATEETQPATAEEEQSVPVCQEGQVLDEESGICMLEEQPAAAEEPQAEEPTEPQSDDEEQSSDQEDSSEDSDSNN